MKINLWKIATFILVGCLVIIIIDAAVIISDSKTILDRDKRLQKIATEFKLSKWIYENSTLISRSQCQEIAREAMKTSYPLLITSIIELESKKFTPGAQSYTKDGKPLAMGWCQINFNAHSKELIEAGIITEVRDLWNTGPNIQAGAFILSQKMQQNGGDVAKALEGYLGGGSGTGAYVLRVLKNYANLSEK